MTMERVTVPVIGAPIDVISWPQAVQRVLAWGAAHESRYVCICNAHVVVTASKYPALQAAVAQADMATPDGAPIAWMLRRLGYPEQRRVAGPDLMVALCERASALKLSVAIFGSTDETLVRLKAELHRRWPALNVADAIAPPFRPLSAIEDDEIVQRLNRSRAQLIFVGLGCPKQELWMAEHRGRVHAVMLGVGAAFDFHAGNIARAPKWMQSIGLEWLHRLFSEPRRLWQRYLLTNSSFVIGAVLQLLSRKGSSPPM
jgi:N-acetylglucosaminyldiphosphoundecaprenol N-acetyl-beta-D-mannosaminyltransferase